MKKCLHIYNGTKKDIIEINYVVRKVKMMNIILAPDSFKGSMTSFEITQYMSESIYELFPDATVHDLPIGDGGEGTMPALVHATNGQFIEVNVTGPLDAQVNARYGVLGDRSTCVIEMAEASGLTHVNSSQMNVMKATTFGTGELIKHALDQGYKDFILAIGGSATNDGGAGMLQALGAQLTDKAGNEIGFGGESLSQVEHIDLSHFDQRISTSKFIIATDVQNPFIGSNGASFVFGAQKGATTTEQRQLDNNLKHWADVINQYQNVKLHHLPGAGAAGGLGGAFKAFFPSYFEDGIEVVIKHTNLESYLPHADLVITGEGKIDHQTFFGKAPIGIAHCAQRFNVPVIFIGGTVDVDFKQCQQHGVIGAFSLTDRPQSLEYTIQHSPQLLKKLTQNIISTYFHSL